MIKDVQCFIYCDDMPVYSSINMGRLADANCLICFKLIHWVFFDVNIDIK